MSEFKEPWGCKSNVYCQEITNADCDSLLCVVRDGMHSLGVIDPDVLSRIVACVNACAGIPTAELVRCCGDEKLRLAMLMKAANFAGVIAGTK